MEQSLTRGTEGRDMLRLTLTPEGGKWKMPALADLDAAQVEAAIAEIEGARPLGKVEPAYNGPQSAALLEALKPIGAKIDPKMERKDMQTWCSAVILALSDLPVRVAIQGARKAIHRPMRFFNEVDGIVRELANEALEKQALALHRLKMMRAEIERAANPPQPQLEKQPKVWTQEDVDEANALFASQGIRTRYKLDSDDPEGVSSYLIDRDELAQQREAERERRKSHIDARQNGA